jgi:predicted DNA binding CopG/RHH family protein
MNNKIIEQIKKEAKQDAKNRKDIRYKKAMALLTRKGFLKTNDDFDKFYQRRLNINDFIWAGKNVEPRILEVLPAAVARLPKLFILNDKKETFALNKVVKDLRNNNETGADFLEMPYAKIRVWMNIPLNDKRTKPTLEKKKMQSFRLNQEVINKIKTAATQKGISDADFIAELVENYEFTSPATLPSKKSAPSTNTDY